MIQRIEPPIDRSATAGWSTRLHRAAYRLAQKVMVLDVTHLLLLGASHAPWRSRNVTGETCRFLHPDDIRWLSVDESYDLRPELACRLDADRDRCFALFCEGKLGAFAWFATDYIEPEHNRGAAASSGVGISFPSQMVFMYKAFVHPSLRGRQLYGHLVVNALLHLKESGCTHILTTADWTNTAALRSCDRVGFEDLGLIWRYGWSGCVSTQVPRRAARLGIQFHDG